MKIVSLFSGAGGLDLGLEMAGHQIVWANDIFADAVKTYRKNIGKHIDDRDIRLVKSKEIPECDVVVGGFPCQGFSVANWTRHIGDERNVLYKEMVRVVESKQPKFFLAENVKGLSSFAKGEALRQIIKDFEKAGYIVKSKIVNAADYGVPQSRHRLLIFGIRSDINFAKQFPPVTTHCNPECEVLGLKPWVSVEEALRGIPEPSISNDLPNHICSKYKLRFNGYLGHRRIDPTKPSPTVTARGDERGGVVVLHHPNNRRRMTARELATVQSFPTDFEFYGCMTSAYRQIANAVPPLLGKAIGEMFFRTR